MITATMITLACFSAIPVILIGASHSTAYAAEGACEFSSSPAATNGIVQQQIDAIARCNDKTRSLGVTAESRMTQRTSPATVNSNPVNSQDAIDDANRLFCPSIPRGSSAEDFQYRAALERCKFGSGS